MKSNQGRNWLLVVVALVVILMNLVILFLSVDNVESFGWFSWIAGLAAITSIGMSITAIVRNDPSWLLLDLIWPG